MKILGIILIAAGITMFAFSGFSFTQKKKVADIGPVQIDKKEDKTVNWPPYTGAIAILGGIAILLVDRKK